ncbi:YtfJ family protein [Nitratiruptor sp. YY09-18]|uniref:YtfJ family protein n=1 Tax=Nitratiruptor sp. YY09-18 TaxID=2724901 RepID=UPI0019153720|nr:YtfJ family protein [Nitratiruptor sp. YY09-18]BCD68517.1 hypothetical protein NitYY0918_C1434 [Nitratiruptor sp. YY09-18]
MKKFLFLVCMVASLYAIEIGQMPQHVILQGKQGYCVGTKKPFDTKTLRGKVTLFVYVDPDKKDQNAQFFEKVKQLHFPKERFNSVVVINMAATWIPNFVLSSILRKKQQQFPRTLYVKDFHKNFVKEWHMADNAMNILILDKDLKVLFAHTGKLTPKQQQDALKILQERIAND